MGSLQFCAVAKRLSLAFSLANTLSQTARHALQIRQRSYIDRVGEQKKTHQSDSRFDTIVINP